MGSGPSALNPVKVEGPVAHFDQCGGSTVLSNAVVVAVGRLPPPGVVTENSFADIPIPLVQCSTPQLLLPMEGSMVRASDLIEGGSVSSASSVQDVLWTVVPKDHLAGVSMSKVVLLESITKPLYQFPLSDTTIEKLSVDGSRIGLFGDGDPVLLRSVRKWLV